MFNITYKTSSGNAIIPIESYLLPQNKLFIIGEIDDSTASEFIQKLMFLEANGSDDMLKIYINSHGGEITSGLLIYDTLKSLQAEYEIYCIGSALSMAAIILAGGQKGRRLILPHSKVMIHEPLVNRGIGGSASTIQRTAESVLEAKQIAIELLASDTGQTKEVIEKALMYDNYMNSDDAVNFGICDKVVTNII